MNSHSIPSFDLKVLALRQNPSLARGGYEVHAPLLAWSQVGSRGVGVGRVGRVDILGEGGRGVGG